MMIVVTGGSGSGKSAYAEKQILQFGEMPRYYIATMENRDAESQKRVDRHQAMRADKKFVTVECPYDLQEIQLEKTGAVLLECMSNLVANEMFQEDGAKENTVPEILEGISEIEKQAKELVIVTNEIFSDGIDYDEETKRYQSYLGKINQELAKRAKAVTEVVYGIPVERKNQKRVIREKKNGTEK